MPESHREPVIGSRTFAERCGLLIEARVAAAAAVLQRLRDERIHTVRVVWCDLHGGLRGKALTADAVSDALDNGIGMVSTLLLKDTSDRTAFSAFDAATRRDWPAFAGAGNLRLMPDPASFTPLPWAPGSAWLRAEPFFESGLPVAADPRRVLQRNLAALAATGADLVCGLEVEFHVYRLNDLLNDGSTRDHLEPVRDPMASAWPPPTPEVSLVHPGFALLSDDVLDATQPVLDIVRSTALGLGLPLRSLEIELGPSQFEAVFGTGEALQTADRMVWFRHGVKQALRRAGYLVSFMCRPPFPNAVASGWHLHHSLRRREGGAASWRAGGAATSASASGALDSAAARLGDDGASWLAGLLAHASGMAALASPTLSGFSRFDGGPMSPRHAVWGCDNRGAMLRLIAHPDGVGHHLENRLGEPAANPYLYIAAQVAAGLDGWTHRRVAPPASRDPYANSANPANPASPVTAPTLSASDTAHESGSSTALPRTLGEALDALDQDPLWRVAFGGDLVDLFIGIKRAEIARHAQASDSTEWQRREYFERL